jgi:hypothetical protein
MVVGELHAFPRLYGNNGTYLSLQQILICHFILELNFLAGWVQADTNKDFGQTKGYLNDYIYVQVHVEPVNCMEAWGKNLTMHKCSTNGNHIPICYPYLL